VSAVKDLDFERMPLKLDQVFGLNVFKVDEDEIRFQRA
jgi:hypothetical protein